MNIRVHIIDEEYYKEWLKEYKKLLDNLIALLREKAIEKHSYIDREHYYYISDYYLIKVECSHDNREILLKVYDFRNNIKLCRILYKNEIKHASKDLLRNLIKVIKKNNSEVIEKKIMRKQYIKKVNEDELIEVLKELKNDDKMKLLAYII